MSGSQPTPTPTPTPTTNDDLPQWAKEQRDSIKALTENMSRLVAVATARNQPAPAAPKEEPEVELTAEELETLPRSQLAEYIANKTAKHLNKTMIEPLKARLNETLHQSTNQTVERLVNEAKAKHPDFEEYSEQIVALSKVHTSLPPEDLYYLAKSKAGKPVNEPKSESKVPKISFGGLKPDNGGTGTGAKNQRMEPREAVKAAWDSAVADLGGEPQFGEEE